MHDVSDPGHSFDSDVMFGVARRERDGDVLVRRNLDVFGGEVERRSPDADLPRAGPDRRIRFAAALHHRMHRSTAARPTRRDDNGENDRETGRPRAAQAPPSEMRVRLMDVAPEGEHDHHFYCDVEEEPVSDPGRLSGCAAPEDQHRLSSERDREHRNANGAAESHHETDAARRRVHRRR